MKTWTVLFAVLALVIAFTSPIVIAQPATAQVQTPLPSNLTFVIPNSTIPPEVVVFLGLWPGNWDGKYGKLDSTLAVTEIRQGEKDGEYTAKTVYSWGANNEWGVPYPGYQLVDGEIKNGELILSGARAVVRYRIEGCTLVGTYRTWNSGLTYGTFTKASLDARAACASSIGVFRSGGLAGGF